MGRRSYHAPPTLKFQSDAVIRLPDLFYPVVMKLDTRLLNLARSSQLGLYLTITLGFGAGLLTILQACWLSKVVSGVFLEGQNLSDAGAYLAFLFLVIVLRAWATWGSEVAAGSVALQVKTSLRGKLYQHLLGLGPEYTRGEQTGELINTAIEGIESLDNYFSQYLPQQVLAALVPLTILFFIFPLDLLSGFILLLTAPLIPVFMILIGNLANSLTKKQWQSLSRMSAYFLDVLQGLTTLKILGHSREQIKVIASVSERFRETTMQVLRVAFLSSLALELIATLSTAIVAVEIGLRLLYYTPGNSLLGIRFEQAFFILLLAPEFYLPLRMLGTRFHAGMAGVTAAGRIFEILAQPAGVSSQDVSSQAAPADDAQGNPVKIAIPPAVKFSQVRFTYPDGRLALDGLSFDLPAGKITALVGASGSGKSTIAQLLLRFLELKEGNIYIEHRSLQDLPRQEWLAKIAWVPQNPYLFNQTVAANIRLGKASADMQAVIATAKQAGAHPFITALPDGYDTLIGERGTRLSAGEAQRIALARAFLKDAPVVILDEASANLDPRTEAHLFSGFQQLMQGRTVLVIAHRLATVLGSDRILVLEKGRLVQEGTHALLAAQDGPYRQLVSASMSMELPNQVAIITDETVQFTIPSRAELKVDENNLDESASQSPGRLSHLLRLLSMLAPFKRMVALSVLLGFVTVGSGIGLMGTSAFIISAAALQPSIADLQVAIVGVRFFGIARGVFRYLERLVSHQVTFQVLSNLRVWFYRSLEPLAPARLSQFQSGDLFSRITGDITSLENFYVRAVAPPLVAGLVAVATALYLFSYDPNLALALLGVLGLAGIGLPFLMKQLGRETGLRLQRVRANLNTILVDGIQGLPDVLAFGQASLQLKSTKATSQELSVLQYRMARLSAMQNSLAGLLAHLGLLIVLILAIPLVEQGKIEGVYLAVLVLVALSSFEGVQPLPLAAQYLENNLAAGRRLFEMVDVRPEVNDPLIPLPLPESPSLAVNNLSFTYPGGHPSFPSQPAFGERQSSQAGRHVPVMQDISFELTPGKRMAIVGPSGAGKTTLVRLLLRFWEYGDSQSGCAGRILLNGKDLRQYHQTAIRSQFGVVSQNAYLFNATVMENLLIASPGATQEQVYDAARHAEIHDFIVSLPLGYQTWIGEQGLCLSAGERQRLAIARALLKQAPILVLDEATANLDQVTEKRVLSTIHSLMKGRTTLMVTHRLVGMEWMDEILVMDAGREIERGQHTTLVKAGGLYSHMWRLQNQFLQETV
jgi:ATP-binding cassette subfamily C protein CydCD